MNRKMFSYPCRSAGIAAAVVLALGNTVFAAQSVSPPAGEPSTAATSGALFLRLDANRDGYLSRDETRGLRDFEQAFRDSDDNRDGRLDADEFAKAQAIQERERVGRVVGDGVITAKVKAALLKDPVVSGLAVNVDTYKGTVQLSGFVTSEQQIRRASEVAAGISGVVDVRNNLMVKS